jgi:DNA polymerase-3 subunit beta
MECVVLQENLTKALSFLSKSFPTHTTTPQGGLVYLETTETKTTLTATDLDITTTLIVSGKTKKPGKTAVSLSVFSSLVSVMSAGKTTLKLEGEELFVLGEKTSASIRTEKAEAPVQNEGKGTREKELKTETLLSIVRLVCFSASTDQTRAVLTGVLLIDEGDRTVFVATDGFRLSCLILKTNGFLGEEPVILPAKSLQHLASLSGGQSSGKAVLTKSGLLRISYEQSTTTMHTIEGKYPDYKKILPKETTNTAVFDREELVSAIKTASVFSKDNANIVKIVISKEGAVVSADSPKSGKGETRIGYEKGGEDVALAFNHRFLLGVLSALDEHERVVMETRGSLQPATFYAEKQKDFFHIIMPIRLQS